MGKMYLSFLQLLSTVYKLPTKQYLTKQVEKALIRAVKTEDRWA
jgi:hypothetical protein